MDSAGAALDVVVLDTVVVDWPAEEATAASAPAAPRLAGATNAELAASGLTGEPLDGVVMDTVVVDWPAMEAEAASAAAAARLAMLTQAGWITAQDSLTAQPAGTAGCVQAMPSSTVPTTAPQAALLSLLQPLSQHVRSMALLQHTAVATAAPQAALPPFMSYKWYQAVAAATAATAAVAAAAAAGRGGQQAAHPISSAHLVKQSPSAPLLPRIAVPTRAQLNALDAELPDSEGALSKYVQQEMRAYGAKVAAGEQGAGTCSVQWLGGECCLTLKGAMSKYVQQEMRAAGEHCAVVIHVFCSTSYVTRCRRLNLQKTQSCFAGGWPGAILTDEW